MDSTRDEPKYDEKLDEITSHLELLILDAVIAALEKLRERNDQYNRIIYRERIII